eukprot:scaffold17463_cov66-Phaeocystis_antarctica.AAC.5
MSPMLLSKSEAGSAGAAAVCAGRSADAGCAFWSVPSTAAIGATRTLSSAARVARPRDSGASELRRTESEKRVPERESGDSRPSSSHELICISRLIWEPSCRFCLASGACCSPAAARDSHAARPGIRRSSAIRISCFAPRSRACASADAAAGKREHEEQDDEDAQRHPEREVQGVLAERALVQRRKARRHVESRCVVERDRLLGARLLERATAAVFEAHVLQVGEVYDLKAELVTVGHRGGEAEGVVEGHLQAVALLQVLDGVVGAGGLGLGEQGAPVLCVDGENRRARGARRRPVERAPQVVAAHAAQADELAACGRRGRPRRTGVVRGDRRPCAQRRRRRQPAIGNARAQR